MLDWTPRSLRCGFKDLLSSVFRIKELLSAGFLLCAPDGVRYTQMTRD